jgi:hypothetical protein
MSDHSFVVHTETEYVCIVSWYEANSSLMDGMQTYHDSSRLYIWAYFAI